MTMKANIALRNETRADVETIALREESRNWTIDMWERYLTSLEGAVYEDQISPWKYDCLAEQMEFGVFEYAQRSADKELELRVRSAMDGLSDREIHILKSIYFNSKSIRQTGREMGLSHTGIRKIRRRALEKMRTRLMTEVSTFVMVEGQESDLEGQNE